MNRKGFLAVFAFAAVATGTAQLSPTINQLVREIQALQARNVVVNGSSDPPSRISYSHVFTHNFFRGATGTEVGALQQFLYQRGFSITGTEQKNLRFGLATEKALTAFQKANHLSPSGFLDAKTRNYINPQRAPMAIVASSSNAIFAYPHATTQIDDQMVLGTVRENPGHIAIFTDPGNLRAVLATTTPGYINLSAVVRDDSRGKLYFIATQADTGHLAILSVDPATLAWHPVFDFKPPTPIDIGFPTLDTDGSYVYVATQSTPPFLLKIKIADWSLVTLDVVPDVPGGFHSSALAMFPGRTEWYVVSFSIPTTIFKVNVSDFSYQKTILPGSGDITNEIYFRPVGNDGGLLYLPSETAFGLEVVDTKTMASVRYVTPPSYGVFSDGQDLYSLDPYDREIIKYPNFDLNKPIMVVTTLPVTPNEWFETSNGNTFFTDFANPSALYQYR